MFTQLSLLLAVLLLLVSPTANSQTITIHVISDSQSVQYTEKIRQQIPIWRADYKGQYENVELDTVTDDLKLYDQAVLAGDSQTALALLDMLHDDWSILEAVDDELKGEDVI